MKERAYERYPVPVYLALGPRGIFYRGGPRMPCGIVRNPAGQQGPDRSHQDVRLCTRAVKAVDEQLIPFSAKYR